jgi:ABC-type polysaccharide/polyol phosphate export permease
MLRGRIEYYPTLATILRKTGMLRLTLFKVASQPFSLVPSRLISRIPGSYFVRNLVYRKSLLFQLVKRDFQQRYVGSAAGWVWSIIHPLVLLAVYTFIYVYCMHQTLEGEVTTSYPLFLFAGMLPWLLFSETVTRSSGSILEQANLITKTMFPSEILPVSIFLSSLVSHAMVAVLVAFAAGVILGHVNAALLLIPFYVVVTGLFAIGLGWIAAALQVYLRDTSQLVVVGMTFWFWLTPIFIREKNFPSRMQWVLWLNPMAYIVRGYRTMLLDVKAPPLRDMATAAGFAVAAFVCGGLFFRQMKKGFADVL